MVEAEGARVVAHLVAWDRMAWANCWVVIRREASAQMASAQRSAVDTRTAAVEAAEAVKGMVEVVRATAATAAAAAEVALGTLHMPCTCNDRSWLPGCWGTS